METNKNMQQNKNNYYNKNNKPRNRTKKALTTEQLYNVMSFVDEYYKTWTGQNGFQGVYTPNLTNQRLGEIGLSSKKITEKSLSDAFKDPINHQEELIGYGEFLKFTDAVAKRTYGYMGNLPAFDLLFTCMNIENKSDYSSEDYKKANKILKNFFEKFDYRGQFAKINRRTLETDTFYSVFRMDGDKYEFQELPYKYCITTGSSPDWGLLFDFDMNWFLKQGLSLDMYPDVFKKMYLDIFDAQNIEKYDPSNKLTQRNGTYGLWTQTSPLPEDGGFTAFKFDSDIYSNIPFLTPLFSDAINKPLLRQLQTNQYIIASQKLLVGLIPLLKEQKSGQIKDALAISPETMGKFLGVLQQGLNEIMVKGVPFSDVKEVTYEMPNKSIYNEYGINESNSSGVTSRVIYSSDKQSALETEYSTNIDELIATAVYPQYERWMTTMVNYLMEQNNIKYRFTIKFEGSKLTRNRKERLDTALKLADKGIVLPQKIAAAVNMNIFELETQLEMGSTSSLKNNLYLLLNSNTKDYGQDNTSGRPQKDTADISDSTNRNDDRIDEGGEE